MQIYYYRIWRCVQIPQGLVKVSGLSSHCELPNPTFIRLRQSAQVRYRRRAGDCFVPSGAAPGASSASGAISSDGHRVIQGIC